MNEIIGTEHYSIVTRDCPECHGRLYEGDESLTFMGRQFVRKILLSCGNCGRSYWNEQKYVQEATCKTYDAYMEEE